MVLQDKMYLNKNKLTAEIYKSENSTLGNLSQNTDGQSIIPEGVKLSSSENQIQPKLQKEQIILVADDDNFNFFIIESLLIPYNFKIIHARDGEKAVNIFRSQEGISLILMDIQMPVMDGITATKEIRKIDKKVPIIAHTSYKIDIEERAIDSGCNDFIIKPINSDLLIHKIMKYLVVKEKDS